MLVYVCNESIALSLGQSSPYPYSPYSNDRSVGYSTRRGDQDHCLLPTFITTALVTTKKRTDRYRYIDIDIDIEK